MNPRVMPGHRRDVTALVFGKTHLLSASRDRTAIVSTLEGVRAHALNGALDVLTGIAELENGKVVTISEDGGVRFYEGDRVFLAKGHTSAVHALAVLGNQVATASEDGSVRLWNGDGSAGLVLRGHEEGARSVEFTGAEELTTTSGGGIVRTWNTKTGALLTKEKAKKKKAKATTELARGVTAEACEDGSVRLKKGKKIAILSGHDDAVSALAVNGPWLAVGAANGAVHLWDWKSALESAPASPPAPPVLERVWSVKSDTAGADTRFDGASLWVGRNGVVHEHALSDGTRGATLAAPGDLCFFGPRHLVFAEYDKMARVVDRATMKVILEVPLENNYLYPRGGPLAWTTKRPGKPNSVRLLDPETQTLASFGEIEGMLDRPIFTPDRARLAVASEERNEVYVFDVASAKLLATLRWPKRRDDNDESAYEIAFTHDHQRVVVGTRDGRAFVFDIGTSELRSELRPPKEPEPRFGWTPVHVSSSLDRAAIWGDDNKHAILFDLEDGKPLGRVFGEETDSGYSTRTFSPDGTRLLALHRARAKLAFHDALTGARIVQHDVHRAGGTIPRFLFVGERVITWAPSEIDRSLRCWETKTGERVWANLGLAGTQIGDVVLSPDERFLAVTARDSELVRVVDVKSGATVAELPGHADYAREPSFSADGSLLATSCNPGDVHLWRLPR